jgi:hypothetical protein
LVQQKLVELGLQPGAGVGLPGDVTMRDADKEMKRLRTTAVGALGAERGEYFATMVGQLQRAGEGAIDRPPAPDWAAQLQDRRGELRFDATQYVCPVGVNGRLTLSIVDTGAHRTVLDTRMAALLGLRVRKEAADCGKFSVPGSDAIHSYAGVVEGETVLQICSKVFAKVTNLRVIEHPHPFFLLGADVLRGWAAPRSVEFLGVEGGHDRPE